MQEKERVVAGTRILTQSDQVHDGVSKRFVGDILVVRIDIDFSTWIDHAGALRTVDQIFDLLYRRESRQLIVDFRESTGSVSFISRYQFLRAIAKRYLGHLLRGGISARIGILISGEYKQSPSFIENVVRNRGLIVQLFTDCRKAVAWVSQDGASSEQERLCA